MTSQQSYSGRLQLNMSKVLWDKHVFNLNLGYEVNSVKYEGSDGWMSPGYNHSQGRSFIELPRFSVPSTGIIEGYGYNNMLSWLSTSGSMDIYPTITDQLKNSLSWFGIFTYSYDNRYILNFNMRSDGSNALDNMNVINSVRLGLCLHVGIFKMKNSCLKGKWKNLL